MNIFTKSLVSVGKIIVAMILVYFTYLLFLIKTSAELYFGIGLLVFITLPTIFVVFFKNKFLAKHPKFTKAWVIFKIIYIVILILFVVGLAFGFYRVFELDRTKRAIEFINSQKITLDDVMGKNLPPAPDQKLNDSTIAGIDANKNYIRDDVELAIFKEYPNSAKIRSAELQYAQALQLELTKVFNSATLVAVMQKESHAIDCIGKTGPNVSLNDTREKIIAALTITNDQKKEVENFVLDTNLRTQTQSNIYKKYMTGYASLPGNECDIEL